MKKGILGRGLDALIPTEKVVPGYNYMLLDVNEMAPNVFQPRKEFDSEALEGLVASIKEKGVIQPLIVRRSENGYEIVAGERRWRAARLAGLSQVPAIIKEASNREALELALVENLQREDLNPIEEATAYEQLIKDFGLTHEEISERIGKERSTITNQLRLLKLPEEVKQALMEGRITAGHARAVLSLQSNANVREVLESIENERLSVRKTEKLVRQKLASRRKGESPVQPEDASPYVSRFADELKRRLGTQVRILDKDGKGKIEIEYYSRDELERLLEILTGGEGMT